MSMATKLNMVLTSESRFSTQTLKLLQRNLTSHMNYYFPKKTPSEMFNTVLKTFLVFILFVFCLHV